MKKVKIFFKVVFILFLCVLLIGSCTPIKAKAIVGESALILATKFIFDTSLAVTLSLADNVNNKTSNIGSVYADTVAIDYSKKSNDIVYTCPLYNLYGKSRFNYSNGNYEIVSLHISIASFNSFYNNQPNDYLPSEFPLYNEGKFPSCGSAVYIRTAYDSSGTILYSRTFGYVYDSMPYVLFYNQADSIGFRPTQNGKGKYWNWEGNGTPYNAMTNDRTFKVSNTNSIVLRSGLDWNDKYSDLDFVIGNYSLVTYFTTEIYSNDSNFINNVNNRYDSLNYGTGFKPVLKKVGIEAKTTINNTNINNYSDYGLTINNFNYTDYTNNFNSVDFPAIVDSWRQLYISQPAVGLSFDSDIRYNYIDISSTPDTNAYLPDSWLSDYPAISTNPNIDIIVTTIPHLTLPSGAVACGAELVEVGYNFYNAVPALVGIVLFFGVAGILINKFLL